MEKVPLQVDWHIRVNKISVQVNTFCVKAKIWNKGNYKIERNAVKTYFTVVWWVTFADQVSLVTDSECPHDASSSQTMLCCTNVRLTVDWASKFSQFQAQWASVGCPGQTNWINAGLPTGSDMETLVPEQNFRVQAQKGWKQFVKWRWW